MTRTMCCATWIFGMAVGTLFVATPAAAVTNRPASDETNRPQPMIQRVEVPVDDTTDEAAQMTLAAALGAAVAAAVRRRPSGRSPARTGTGTIDITATVMHQRTAEDAVAAGRQPSRR